jgi:IS30 family transposase
MRRNLRPPWTEDEDELLASLLARGVSLTTIATRLGRTSIAIRTRRDAIRRANRAKDEIVSPADGASA